MAKYRIKRTTVNELVFEIDIDSGGDVNPLSDTVLNTINNYLYTNYIESKIIKDTYEIVRKD